MGRERERERDFPLLSTKGQFFIIIIITKVNANIIQFNLKSK